MKRDELVRKLDELQERLGEIVGALEGLRGELSQLRELALPAEVSEMQSVEPEEVREPDRVEVSEEAVAEETSLSALTALLIAALYLIGGCSLGIFILCGTLELFGRLEGVIRNISLYSLEIPLNLKYVLSVVLLLSVMPSFIKRAWLALTSSERDLRALMISSLGYLGAIITASGLILISQSFEASSWMDVGLMMMGSVIMIAMGALSIYPLKLRGPGGLMMGVGLAFSYVLTVIALNKGLIGLTLLFVLYVLITAVTLAAAYIVEMPLISTVSGIAALMAIIETPVYIGGTLATIILLSSLILLRRWREDLEPLDIVVPMLLSGSVAITLLGASSSGELPASVFSSLIAIGLLAHLFLAPSLSFRFKLVELSLVSASLALALYWLALPSTVSLLPLLTLGASSVIIAYLRGERSHLKLALLFIVPLTFGLARLSAYNWLLWGAQASLIAILLSGVDSPSWIEYLISFVIPVTALMPYLSQATCEAKLACWQGEIPFLWSGSLYLLLNVGASLLIIGKYKRSWYFGKLWAWYPVIALWLWSLYESWFLSAYLQSRVAWLSKPATGLSTLIISLLGISLLIVGVTKDERLLMWQGVASILIGVLKLTLVDMSSLSVIVKGMIATVLGIIFLGGALLWYSLRRDRIREGELGRRESDERGEEK